MADHLKHLIPANHPEAGWADVIRGIPKPEGDYDAQLRILKGALAGKTIARLLDVGAGEGSFTQTIIDLLQHRGEIEVGNVQIHVIEKDDSLFERLHQGHPAWRRLDYQPAHYALPEETDALLDAVDRLSTSGVRYDLIVASHVTYYFDNGGATLAYALSSRLLSDSGVLWIITRDRSCPFYQLRESILLEEMLHDVNRHRFSDSLIDRLSCLFRLGDESTAFQMKLSRRLSGLNPPHGGAARRRFFEYLLWLKNLSNKHLSRLEQLCGQPGQTDVFSETHVFLPRLERLHPGVSFTDSEYERSVMQQVAVVSDCIDVVRRLDSAVQVHRVSLASVTPRVDPEPENLMCEEPDLPSLQPKHFSLSAVGFGYYPDQHQTDSALSEFFKKNSSFLFYPRFYCDYRSYTCDEDRTPSDFALLLQLKGSPKVQRCTDYNTRRIHGPAWTIEQQTGTTLRLMESVEEWHKLLRKVYCNDAQSGYSVWSICVGATVAPDPSRAFQDRLLNECCGLFMIVSTREGFKDLEQAIVPQMRARLTQWLGHKFFVDGKRRQEELWKQAQMFALIARPLKAISDALSAMQSHTQELRAVIYEPEEALFASYRLIEPYFNANQPIHFPKANLLPITVKHTPDHYNEEEARLVLAVVCCAVFGKEAVLFKQHDLNRILCEAAKVMSEAQTQKALARLSLDLCWLVKQRDLSRLFREPRRDEERLQKATYTGALGRMKGALFTPFKTDSLEWSQAALQLLHRHESLRQSRLIVCETEYSSDSPPSTNKLEGAAERFPCSFASALAFFRDVACAARAHRKPATVAALSYERDCRKFSLEFNESPKINTENLRVHSLSVLGLHRDWRLDGVNYGDMTRAFIVFANRLLGIGNDWQIESIDPDDRFSIVRLKGHQSFFVISWDPDSKTLSVSAT